VVFLTDDVWSVIKINSEDVPEDIGSKMIKRVEVALKVEIKKKRTEARVDATEVEKLAKYFASWVF
jgi:hypothetical protein